jgi:hypothetical protein
MLRRCLLLFGLIAATTCSSGGCRSCSTCHDYGPPVANCECQACGVHRAGSASGGYVDGGYVENGYADEGYYPTEGEVVEQPGQQYEEPAAGQPTEEF